MLMQIRHFSSNRLNTYWFPNFTFLKLQVPLTPHQRALINELITEASSAINDVIRQPQMTSTCVNTDLTVPPNTPSAAATSVTSFEFPETEDHITSSSSSSDEGEGQEATPRSRPARKMKRRRPPSFKNKHRVAPKKVTSDLEADDEASEASEDKDLELSLKLNLLSETRNNTSNSGN